MEMKKIFCQCVVSLFILALTTSAMAVSMISVPNEYNALGFRVSEIVLDQNGNFYTDPTHVIGQGDIFCGVLDVTSLVAPTNNYGIGGPNVWPGTYEVSGYYAGQVDYVMSTTNGPILVMKALTGNTGSEDPFSILDTTAGEVLRMFYDETIDFDDSTQALAFSTATDGTHMFSLGMGSSTDSDSLGGYWYTVLPTGAGTDGDDIGTQGKMGTHYAGMNFIGADDATPPSGRDFVAINDPSETLSSTLVAGAGSEGADVEIWFNAQIYEIDHDFTDTVLMHLGGGDPGVFFPKPIPIPGAIWLLGVSLAGLLGFRKKVSC
jgi:hypothetical protein